MLMTSMFLLAIVILDFTDNFVDGDIEIIQGLLDGDHVVTSAQFMLDSESKLREAIQKMLNPQPPSAADHADHDMGEKDEDLGSLFADDGEEGEESLEDLFDDSDEVNL